MHVFKNLILLVGQSLKILLLCFDKLYSHLGLLLTITMNKKVSSIK